MAHHELTAATRKREGPRTVKVTRYPVGKTIVLSVGAPSCRARGAATLTPNMARQLADLLIEEADNIDATG